MIEQTQQPIRLYIPYTDLKPKINNFLHKKLRQPCDKNIHDKVFQIKPIWGEWRPAFRKSRREQVAITRLRIRPTGLTHSCLIETLETIYSCVSKRAVTW